MLRRLALIGLVIPLAFSYFAFFSFGTVAASEQQVCITIDFTLTNSDSVPHWITLFLYNTVTSTIYVSVTRTINPGETILLRLSASVPESAPIDFDGDSDGIGLIHGFISDVSEAACGFGQIGDGRINDGPDQEGAPLAAYCSNGAMSIWDIDDTGHGTLAFTASKGDISAALSKAISSGKNVLVGQGLGDSLYALSSNQLTLVGPDVKEPSKTYEFVTTPDICG